MNPTFTHEVLFIASNVPSAILGLVVGVCGVLYGLKAREFIAYGFRRSASKEPEKVVPTWYHRLWVVLISTVAIVASLRTLLKNL